MYWPSGGVPFGTGISPVWNRSTYDRMNAAIPSIESDRT